MTKPDIYASKIDIGKNANTENIFTINTYFLDRQFDSISDLPPLSPKFRQELLVILILKTLLTMFILLTCRTITKYKQTCYYNIVKSVLFLL